RTGGSDHQKFPISAKGKCLQTCIAILLKSELWASFAGRRPLTSSLRWTVSCATAVTSDRQDVTIVVDIWMGWLFGSKSPQRLFKGATQKFTFSGGGKFHLEKGGNESNIA